MNGTCKHPTCAVPAMVLRKFLRRLIRLGWLCVIIYSSLSTSSVSVCEVDPPSFLRLRWFLNGGIYSFIDILRLFCKSLKIDGKNLWSIFQLNHFDVRALPEIGPWLVCVIIDISIAFSKKGWKSHGNNACLHYPTKNELDFKKWVSVDRQHIHFFPAVPSNFSESERSLVISPCDRLPIVMELEPEVSRTWDSWKHSATLTSASERQILSE